MTDQPDFIDTIIDDMEDTHGSVDFFSTTRVAVRIAIERAIRETRPDHPTNGCDDCGHSPDCATHNMPAMKPGHCECDAAYWRKPIAVGIDLGDPEAEPMFHAAGGWCAPSRYLSSIAPSDLLPPEIPVVRSPRGGIPFGTVAPKPEPEVQEPSPDGSAGHWEYGADLADYDDGDTGPEIVASASGWHWEPFRLAVEVAERWPGRPIMKRWVPDRGDWTEA